MKQQMKDLYWIGAAKKELGSLPAEVVEDFKTDTYRAVYTVKFGNAVYVLYCFQKKSKKGIKTPKPDMDIIMQRLKTAKVHAEGEGNE